MKIWQFPLYISLLSAVTFPVHADPLEKSKSMILLFDFETGEKVWKVIDDGVMGGVSKGNWRTGEGIGIFQGELSLENNGGFSSVRSAPLAALPAGISGFRLRVKGDGRTYQFRLRTDANFDGASYQVEFTTRSGEWQEIELKIDLFKAVFRGNVLKDYPALSGEKVVTAGFLLADKKAGPFRLEVDWIGINTKAPPTTGTE